MIKKLLIFVLFMTNNLAIAGTQATNLAEQMGGVAGIAEACGQNINLLNRRVHDSIKLIAANAGDAENALRAYNLAYRANFNLQVSVKSVPCKQALQTYRDLPLLQNDYENALLQKKALLRTNSYLPKSK